MVATSPLSRMLKQRSGVVIVAASIVLIVVALIALLVSASGSSAGGPLLLDSAAKLSAAAAAAAHRGSPAPAAILHEQIEAVTLAQAASRRPSDQVGRLIGSINSDEATINSDRAGFDTAQSALKSLGDGVPQLMRSTQQVAERLATRNGSPGQIYLAAGQMIRLERLRAAVSALTLVSGDIRTAAAELDSESKGFAQNQKVLSDSLADLHDGQFDSLMQTIGSQFAEVSAAVTSVTQVIPALTQIRGALNDLSGHADALVQAVANKPPASEGFINLTTPTIVAVAAGALAALLLVVFIVMSAKSASKEEETAEESDAQQQQAILNLLDEITKLANGDLTVDVTVTEDFTGAIADSINYTVQTLRGLVSTINESSVELAEAAATTLTLVRQMNVDSESQAREISSVASNMSLTSDSLQAVAASALGLAAQAQTSVQTAHDGAATVGRTIQNMASLREQIQDTAKRIKRLGESSQEIGNIIEFINDLSEQTNTLALNASIQAAMAGESGRGFAVVADEVQKLAERAGSATRQIENLVKTIQADTTEAIISMERSTANVVSGARSAEEAGQSLTKIEAASQELSGLIQNISGAARDQSTQTTIIAKTMQAIREITMQTANSAETTAQAVSDLNVLSDKLRESVAGFKLPTEALGHDGL